MARSGSLTSPSTTPSAGQAVSSSSASGRPQVAASTRSIPTRVETIAYARFPTIIVLDGGGYREGARQWLIAQRGKRNLVDVCSQGDISRMQTQGRI